jgi:hypothetical protein
MGIECGVCERDLRGGHAPDCPLQIARKIARDVAELPDRTRPEGQPEMMLVTADELIDIIVENFDT